MPNIHSIGMLFLDELFEMRSGYVLSFSDRTMSRFFAEELNVDIDDPAYGEHGGSKGKRLRCFLQKVEITAVVKTLKSLWEYREAIRMRDGKVEEVENAQGRLLSLINRLEGRPDAQRAGQTPKAAYDRPKLLALRNDLIGFAQLAPQARDDAFETLLRDLSNVFGLQAREPFRLKGEQIDGRFVLQGETYLIEAKWQAVQMGVADLHTFHGKLEQKAAWTRGLFVSNSGFTEDGLAAFGKGKRVICMDGLDHFETLSRKLPLNHVLEKKVRRAAETGLPFCESTRFVPRLTEN